MRYVYPKLSDKDFCFIRLGGLGLGNMLFPYARAVLYGKKHQMQLIWPTWVSIPVGQIIRREDNKRFYHDLFCNRIGALQGLSKFLVLISHKKRKEGSAVGEGEILVFQGMEGEFEPIAGKENSKVIKSHLEEILQDRNKKALTFDPGDGICVHIRLGDFIRGSQADLKAGNPNTSIPVSWYIDMIRQIRQALGKELPVYLFSDGTEEELKEILSLPGVEKITFGTAIADILAMSGSRIFLASGSTFSRWVRYLGRMHTITYPGQLKQHLLEPDEDSFEIEAEQIPKEYLDRLKRTIEGIG